MSLRRSVWPAAVACVAVLLMAAACPKTTVDPPPVEPTSGPATSTAASPPTSGPDCGAAGGKTGVLLPSADADFLQVAVNPCVPLAELAGAVLEFVPDADPAEPRIDKKQFRALMGTMTGRVLAVNDLAECAYQTDLLAIGVYRQSGHLWSVGVAAVIRGDVVASAKTGFCWILKQILIVNAPKDARPGPRWEPCVDASRPTKNGEVYAVLVAGTSDEMCRFVRKAL